MSVENRTCNRCGVTKEIGNFALIKNKNFARRRVCYSCRAQGERQKASYSVRQKDKNEALKKSRRTSESRAKHIRWDSARYDRRYGHITENLPIDWIEEQISKPCSYCERQLSKLEMTLDRVDNNKGHTQDNLIPSCSVCNYFRRDMPYEAWLLFMPSMKKALHSGLLDNWNAGGRLRGIKNIIHENTINQPQAVLGRSN